MSSASTIILLATLAIGGYYVATRKRTLLGPGGTAPKEVPRDVVTLTAASGGQYDGEQVLLIRDHVDEKFEPVDAGSGMSAGPGFSNVPYGAYM